MRFSLILILTALALLAPSDAWACGTCIFAAFDRVLPPVGLWFIWALGWFTASAAVLTFSKESLRPLPRLPLAGALVAAAILGTSFLGPTFGFALAVLPAAAFVGAWRGERTPAKRRLRWVAAAALVAAAGLGARSYLIHGTRTDGDFVVQWETTVPASQVFAYLAADPAAHEAELRKIALLGTGELAKQAKALLETR